MDNFNCECCNKVVWFEDTYYSATGKDETVTFYYPPYGRDYTTTADCVCAPCGLAASQPAA